MSSSECSQLTGKLCFTCTWVFNNIGRAMLQPLYYRQHNGPPGSSPLTPRLCGKRWVSCVRCFHV